MLSKKMTVSLMSLITILAFAFMVPSVMAESGGPTVTISTSDDSTADGKQVVPIDPFNNDPKIGATPPTEVTPAVSDDLIVITVEFSDPVKFNDAAATATDTPPADFAPNQDVMLVYALGDSTVELSPTPTITWLQVNSKKYIGHFVAEDFATLVDDTPDNEITRTYDKVTVYIEDDAAMAIGGDTAGKTSQASGFYMFTVVIPDTTPPTATAALADEGSLPLSGETARIIITLSEAPKEFKAGHIAVTEASIVSLDKIDDTNYLLTIKPKYEKTDAIKLTVKHFEDQRGNSTMQTPGQDNPIKDQEFSVAASAVAAKPGAAGTSIGIPNDLTIPAGGSLVVAKDDGDGSNSQEKTSESLIAWPGDPKATAANIALRVPKFRTYNVIEAGLPNLETFLINGGTIDLIAADKVIVSEVMWGTDAGSQNRQWIEIMNTTDAAITTKGYKLMLYDANEVVPVTETAVAAVAATATTVAVAAIPVGSVPANVADRVGTIYKGAYWSVAGKGQSGNIAGTISIPDQDVELVGVTPLISMQRGKANAKGEYPMGTMASSWSASTPPSLNLHADGIGRIIATPGAMPIISDAAAKAAAEAEAKAETDAAAKAADTSVSMPAVGQIYISEVMFAGGGTLPQWIEISNGSRSEQVNLSGWTLTVDNAAADADVSVGASIKFTIPEGTMIDPSGQADTPSTLLVVTETGRNNLTGAMAAGQVLNIWETQQTELILGGVTKRRYSLLSGMAFQITLAPPVPIVVPAKAAPAPTTAAEIAAARKAAADKKAADAEEALARAEATDTVGNLGADGAAAWALPMNEDGGRSSVIRRHVPVSIGPAEPEDGTMMDSWALASDTSFAQITHVRASSYYGAVNDVGTPGFRAGGALPVQLSQFRPARDKATGAVVITWSTQSELNNAGFFIKRSQQRDGEFKIINAAMIQGAGTTSEKQFYTYNDTTAQPNVVYYYQIEDVSLDGNRQTLTNGIRLKGHISVAGKLTTTWGDLKTSQ